jgi:hypothetical protein
MAERVHFTISHTNRETVERFLNYANEKHVFEEKDGYLAGVGDELLDGQGVGFFEILNAEWFYKLAGLITILGIEGMTAVARFSSECYTEAHVFICSDSKWHEIYVSNVESDFCNSLQFYGDGIRRRLEEIAVYMDERQEKMKKERAEEVKVREAAKINSGE